MKQPRSFLRGGGEIVSASKVRFGSRITGTYRQPLQGSEDSQPQFQSINYGLGSVGSGKTHLSIICLARGEQGIERVVARNQETGKVDEELASDVEEDEEGVDTDQAKDDIDLRNGGLALEVVEDRVLGEL